MVNDYLKNSSTLDGATSVLQAPQSSTQQSKSSSVGTSNPGNANSAIQSSSQGASQTGNSNKVEQQIIPGSLTAALLQKVGLQNYSFQEAPYSGKLFDTIPFQDLSFVQTSESSLNKNQVVQVASFDEFNPGTVESAQEVYDLVKEKCIGETDGIVNETNNFGEQSFYLNYFQHTEKVFLVFRKGTRVFAFRYDKDLHDAMTKLIELL